MGEMSTFYAFVGVLAAICAIVFGWAQWKRTKGLDDKGDGQKNGQLISDIGYVKSGIDDIKRKQEKQDENYVDIVCRVVAVEGSAKQAHHRIDTVEENIRTQGQYNPKGLE